MNWFWHALWICFVVIPVTILWIVCTFDILFRRSDIAWWKRLLWLLLVLVLPLFGALIYALSAMGPLRSDSVERGTTEPAAAYVPPGRI